MTLGQSEAILLQKWIFTSKIGNQNKPIFKVPQYKPQYRNKNICSFQTKFPEIRIFSAFSKKKPLWKRIFSHLSLTHCYYGAYFAVPCSFVKMGLFWGSKFEFFGGFSNFSHFYFKSVTEVWWWWWGRRKRLIFETGMIESRKRPKTNPKTLKPACNN